MQEKNYSLSELTSHINEVLKVNFDSPIWIRAEISELRENANGHCYLELVEKDALSDSIIAKIRANIWASGYRIIKSFFYDSTGETLRSGLKVLVAVTVDFHNVYGMSLNIRDIDPSFTIGDLSARRKAIIKQLETDGIMDMNKGLEMPLLPRRIAIVSSATAAGYEDFCNQLESNSGGFRFYHHLFPAIMQGDQAEASIISALDQIFGYADYFDVVVIIRGGGASTDLACFDSYEMAVHCAQFPLPVITGIGHTRDLTILDMVAHQSAKTPTAVAELLIDKMHDASVSATEPFGRICELAADLIKDQEQYLSQIHWKMRQALQQKSTQRHIQLEKIRSGISNAVRLTMQYHKNKIFLIESNIEKHSPAFLLRYGYSITTLNGKRISSVKEVKSGDTMRTWLTDGTIESVVTKTEES